MFLVGLALSDIFRILRLDVQADDLAAYLGVAVRQGLPNVAQPDDADNGGFVV